MEERVRKARKQVAEELKEKYRDRINYENSKIRREQKFAESLDTSRTSNNDAVDLVRVEIEDGDTQLVPRSQCVVDADGNWVRKQNASSVVINSEEEAEEIDG